MSKKNRLPSALRGLSIYIKHLEMEIPSSRISSINLSIKTVEVWLVSREEWDPSEFDFSEIEIRQKNPVSIETIQRDLNDSINEEIKKQRDEYKDLHELAIKEMVYETERSKRMITGIQEVADITNDGIAKTLIERVIERYHLDSMIHSRELFTK
jgi:hypothetical protein